VGVGASEGLSVQVGNGLDVEVGEGLGEGVHERLAVHLAGELASRDGSAVDVTACTMAVDPSPACP